MRGTGFEQEDILYGDLAGRERVWDHIDLATDKKVVINVNGKPAEVLGYVLRMPGGDMDIKQRENAQLHVDQIRDWLSRRQDEKLSADEDNPVNHDLTGREVSLDIGGGRRAPLLGYVLDLEGRLEICSRDGADVDVDQIRDWLGD